MIVEERNYAFAAADLPRFLDIYEREGVFIATRLLGNLIGYFRTEVGSDLNEVVHLWGFDDLNDRATRRAALWTDAEWLDFAARCPSPVHQRNRLLMPTSWSPIR
jgi:hypothetical protein